MSRTDKTKPWWVRVAEHPPWQEVHNHISGVCTLPASPYDRDWTYRGCYYRDWNLAYSSCCAGCGCGICSDQDGRRIARRRERRNARQWLDAGRWDML